MKHTIITITLVHIFLVTLSQEVYQWREQDRTGIYPKSSLLKTWEENRPQLLWSADSLPKGYASLSIVNDRIYTTGKNDSIDICIALDISGNIIWQTEYGRSWNASYPDSRCTPTYDNGKLYVSSGFGDVACLNAKTGEIIWKVKGYETFNIHFNRWGIAESLIVKSDKVIFNPIGEQTTTVALNKETGEIIWKSESISDSAAYVSPVLINYKSKNIIVNVSASNIYGVDLKNGNLLWTFKYYDINTPDHPSAPIINCNSPVYDNGYIYVTSGYNHTGVMLQLVDKGNNVKMMWADTVLDTHHGGVVKIGDYIYGSNWINNGTGNWCCINWKTGEKKWDQKWHSKGSIISADGMLYIYDEKQGNVGLLEANPEEFNLISSFKIPPGKGPHWSHPVIYKGVMYIRHTDVLMAFNIKAL